MEEKKKQMTAADLRQMADLYHVPVSDETLKGIAGENLTPEKAQAFEEYIKTAAQGLFPTLAPQIKAGIPTAYLLDPYKQVAKQTLGQQYEPDFVGDPAASAALQGNTDPTTGRPAPMTLDQWKGHLRTDPRFGWDSTPQAIGQAHQVIQALHEGFNKGNQ